jgi:uncharacterized protein (TIGR02996 family)
MTHEEAFLADIREHPDDDAPRLIFADWLDENGDADRAEFIRLRIAHHRERWSGTDPRHLRSLELLTKHWSDWVGKLADLVRYNRFEVWLKKEPQATALERFQRGFITDLHLEASQWVNHGEAILRLAPLTHLRLMSGGEVAAKLAQCATLKGIYKIDFVDYYRAPIDAGDMLHLAQSPHLTSLRALRMPRNYLGDAGVEAMTRAPWFATLKVLDLKDNGLSAQVIDTLFGSSPAFRPVWLELGHNLVGDQVGIRIGGSSVAGSLVYLGLNQSGLTPTGLRALSQADLPALRTLSILGNRISNVGAYLLAAAPWLSQLNSLDYDDVSISADAWHAVDQARTQRA